MKILFVSLGCDKNLVDTEMMLGELSLEGHEFTDDESEAEVIIVNTCSFIRDAKAESIETLIRMGKLKNEGHLKLLIATGCLAQRYFREIREQIPEVDIIIGTMAVDEIVNAVSKAVKDDYLKDINGPLVYGKKRILTTGGHYAYLKIADGCDKHCTYCAIPSFRGRFRSVPMDVLIEEAKTLADSGTKEIILVAQETTVYGTDLYGRKMLPELIRRLSEIQGIYFIRLLYCYPEEIDDELIAEIKNNEKVCHYIDMPIQHSSDSVLKRMGRRTSEEDLKNIISKLRKEIPDICLRTTLISGFPGETQKDHKKMLQFVKEMRFDRLGVFTYSKEDNTAAARMGGQIPEFVKKIRRNSIMKAQQAIAFEKARETIGKRLVVMVEGRIPEDNVYVTRTYKDAPGVDGYMFVETSKELMSSDVLRVVCTGAEKYDLMGVPEDEFTE